LNNKLLRNYRQRRFSSTFGAWKSWAFNRIQFQTATKL